MNTLESELKSQFSTAFRDRTFNHGKVTYPSSIDVIRENKLTKILLQ
jgi:hypothetical protein